MAEWTESAKQELEKYLSQVKATLDPSQVDSAEVLDDLRLHVEEEVKVRGLSIVTAEEVKSITVLIGTTGDQGNEGETTPTAASPLPQAPAQNNPGGPGITVSPEVTKKASRKFRSALVLIFGFILPAITLAVEAATGLCGDVFINPIPTIFHILLIAIVPASNFAVFILRDKSIKYIAPLSLLNGIAIGVALYYAVLFAPMIPIGLYLVLFGLGLLVLAPALSFIATLLTRKYLVSLVPANKKKNSKTVLAGIFLALALLFVLELPYAVTEIGIGKASSYSEQDQQSGIRLLRRFGNRDIMLRACYDRNRQASSVSGIFGSWMFANHAYSIKDAREIYYRVTGVPFNSVPPPDFSASRSSSFDDFNFDPDVGGEFVSGRLEGLDLASSRIDVSIDADAVLAYTEWTIVFKNEAYMDREARAQIELPAGGVVSRLTLWVDGVEREAVIAGTSDVREAYEEVVRQKRDPVLITSSGPGRVLMQCFPVPANGGQMKVRIGITSPLVLREASAGSLQMPYFSERNFNITEKIEHSVWAESKNKMRSNIKAMELEELKDGAYAIRGPVGEADLSGTKTFIYADRDKNAMSAIHLGWETADGDQYVQNIFELPAPEYDRIVLVVDGSLSMKEKAPRIADAFATLPDGPEYFLLIANDEAVTPPTDKPLTKEQLSEVLKSHKFIGGQDNISTLVKAWDKAAQKESSAVVWIHGPLPVDMFNIDSIDQRSERRPGAVDIIAIQAVLGTNVILEDLEYMPGFKRMERGAPLKEDIEWLFGSFEKKQKVFNYERYFSKDILPAHDADMNSSDKQTSFHLARLWAADEVKRILSSGEKNAFEKALQIAVNYRIVTPISGAVVLENDQQYEDAGLEPPVLNEIPTIPEPEVIALVAIALLMLGFAVFTMRRRQAQEF